MDQRVRSPIREIAHRQCGFAPEPRHLTFGVLASGLRERSDALLTAQLTTQMGAHLRETEDLPGGGADLATLGHFGGDPSFEHRGGPSINAAQERRAVEREGHTARRVGAGGPLRAETGERAAGEETDFERADHAPGILQVELRGADPELRAELDARPLASARYCATSKAWVNGISPMR